MLQISQDKVWVWGESGPLAALESLSVKPPLNPFLADVEGIQGVDGGEMLEVNRPGIRDLPYSERL